MDRPFNTLFLCTGNSARSIIAEAILNQIGAGKFKAYSAGSQPKGHVNPHTLQLLRSLGYETSEYWSKSWSVFAQPAAPDLDFVFTVCDNAAGEACPVWPGQPMTAHWGVSDPAEAAGSDAEVALAFKGRVPDAAPAHRDPLPRCRSAASTRSACNAAWIRSAGKEPSRKLPPDCRRSRDG